MTDILAGNTNPNVNPFWGKFAITGPDGRRPATLKTGTNNDAKDLNAYGYIAPPTDAGRRPARTRSRSASGTATRDNSLVSTPGQPLFSIDVSTYVWQGFLQEATPSPGRSTDFAPARRPGPGQDRPVDRVASRGPATSRSTSGSSPGTEPKDAVPVGHVRRGRPRRRPGSDEPATANWMTADRDWLRRAKRGPGVSGGGPDRTRTAYFYNGVFQPYGRSWGALVGGHGCAAPSPSPSCYPVPTPDPSGVVPSFVVPSADPSANLILVPCPTPVPLPSASASVEPSGPPTPTPAPTDVPTATPAPTPTEAPTPPPTPTPTAGASTAELPSGAP